MSEHEPHAALTPPPGLSDLTTEDLRRISLSADPADEQAQRLRESARVHRDDTEYRFTECQTGKPNPASGISNER